MERPDRTGLPGRSPRAWLAATPRWQVAMLVASVACVVVGGAAWLAQDAAPAPVPGGAGTDGLGGGAGTFVPTDPGRRPPPGDAAAPEPAAKGVARLGFGFLAGFGIGAFARAAMKLVAIVLGFFVAALLLLEYAGFVTVEWAAIDAAWDGFWARVGAELGDFQRFVTGRLPAAGLTGLGLYAGFRRR